jgi:threonine dehydrogenase-like Zn-dependent dehydrogenase
LAGALPANLPLPYLHVRINSLTVRGSFAQRREDVEATIRMVESGVIKLRKAVVGEFALEDVQRALQLARQSDGWDKMVVLKP